MTSDAPGEQTALETFAAADDDVDEANDGQADESLEAVVDLLERQAELLERVAAEATATPSRAEADTEGVDHGAPDHISRGFW